MIQKIWHYSHAIEIRAFLLNELRILRKKGVIPPVNLTLRTLLHPTDNEKWINFLRFIDPINEVHLIDVGANTGYWSEEFMKVFPNTRLTAFEPVASTFRALKDRFSDRAEVELHNCALSNKDGNAEIHVSPLSTYSSFEIYEQAIADVRGNHIDSEETVRVQTLDGFNLEKEKELLVLKIDVQGHEENMLLGAKDTLEIVDVMLCEVSFANEYKDLAPSFSRVCELASKANLHPVIFQDYKPLASTFAVERDVLFVKRYLLDNIYN